jgi:alkanesulfonate monooxygenase SsuD/methylene tetrahydromethanopterin reductase-like flavin-dependent oxidoreductase (luciferase family)
LLVAAFGPRMLRLTARYADMWNTAWLGEVEGLREPVTQLRKACADVGRDPDTLDVTASVSVVFPEFGETNSFAREPLSGSVESLAKSFKKYADAGTTHLVIQHTPSSLPALERLIEAARLYRNMAR